MTDKQPEKHAEMAPDPDEDDLSDLDDMLEEFSAANIKDKSTKPAPPPATASTKPAPQPQQPPADDNDFTRQLQAGMADLLGQLDSNPDMQKQFEAMMTELSSAAAQEAAGDSSLPATPPPAAPSPVPTAAPEATPSSGPSSAASFQDTIKKTMERMQSSGQSASAAATTSSEEDLLAQMLKELESGEFSGIEGENGEDFNKMLMGMMEQLTNKEILYEPMKELHDKFPDWLAKNSASVSQQDLARYKQQQSTVADIVATFEKKDYSDENTKYREHIVEKMQQMQAAGSPPPDLVGDMNAAQEALGDMDGGCNQQ